MKAEQVAIAERCLSAAETGSMTFPQIVGDLMQAGFESYAVDFRRGVVVYYLVDGDAVQLPAPAVAGAVAAHFDRPTIESAIREAQSLASDYTYLGFCEKTRAAGCVGYVVSFLGRRAVYSGRSGENHVEMFPSAA
jgi:uncharacterized protein YbcV (DUF1398 family)